MLWNIRVPEQTTFASPFKRKKAISDVRDYMNDENSCIAENGEFINKAILGKNARTNKSFKKNNQQDMVTKSCLKKAQNNALRDIANKIDVPIDNILQKEKEMKSPIKEINTNNFFNTCDNKMPTVEKKTAYKRFFAQDLLPTKVQKQKSKSAVHSKKKNTKTKVPHKKQKSLSQQQTNRTRRTMSNLPDFPSNYNNIQQYLQNNCLNLKPIIFSKMTQQSALRKKLQLRKSNLNQRI